MCMDGWMDGVGSLDKHYYQYNDSKSTCFREGKYLWQEEIA